MYKTISVRPAVHAKLKRLSADLAVPVAQVVELMCEKFSAADLSAPAIDHLAERLEQIAAELRAANAKPVADSNDDFSDLI
ncbi:hypothetical protein V2P20_11475 [Methylobacter sp. Wu1]|uniref:hypothetical protein n=1 Tax=Methylobacter sp. Wu1 TaxID=3119359 RepID=UPI002F9534DF